MSASRHEMTNAVVAVAAANLVGLSLLIFALFLYHRTEAFVERAWPTPGVVVGYERGDSEDAQAAPVVRFETNRGEERRFRADLYVAWRDYGMGDTVPVLYDPQRPADARVDDSLLLWVAPLVSAAFGLILILGSSGALVVTVFCHRRQGVLPPRIK